MKDLISRPEVVDTLVQDINKETQATPENAPEEANELTLSGAPLELIHALSLSCSAKSEHQFNSVESKNVLAVSFLKAEQAKNQRAADFIELKISTEKQLKEIFGE